MQNPEEVKRLEEELKKSLTTFVESGKLRLNQNRILIDGVIKDIIATYSNDIRNIAIISGTIAPFSLTLLSVERLNVNIYSLVAGFMLLLINIVLAQFFLKELAEKNDRDSVKAEISWLFAEFDLQNMGDMTKSVGERTNKITDYFKNVSEVESLLGSGSYSLNLQTLRAKLRKYNRITNLLFFSGAVFIILSVIINPTINQVFFH